MNAKLVCQTTPSAFHYEIEFIYSLLEHLTPCAQYLSTLGSKFALISNSLVGPLHAQHLYEALKLFGLDIVLFLIEDGEEFKTRESKEWLEDQMMQSNLRRDSCVIAMGGGVILDLAGFVAATYCRGIPFIAIPTSLLAMVDVCIGGKTAVNLPQGKNLVGTIYPPQHVYIDSILLKTLDKREIINGFAEIIKHALLFNRSFFDYLAQNRQALLNLEKEQIEKTILISCQLKIQVVENDEQELGMRRLLNFGHTIAHALEKLSSYQLAHGEAVAIGLITESYLSVLEGYLSLESFNQIMEMIKSYPFPLKLPVQFSFQELFTVMLRDKKSKNNQIRFVLISKIGTALDFNGQYCCIVNSSHLSQALEWMYYDLCGNTRT